MPLRKFLLTFDTEDFISENSVPVLLWILERLKKHDLEALFFITGHMAETLQNFPTVIDLVAEHQVGYHSSSHSVHPAIFEFTDVEDYKEAYENSLARETAHVNPCTGEIEGKGGILALKRLFHRKHIESFRAPGNCWTPPHLEALKTLGINFDFSTDLSSTPINFKDTTFYPYPVLGHWEGKPWEQRLLLASILKKKLIVLTCHPSLLVNKTEWDSIYFDSNPKTLTPPRPRNPAEARHLLHNFDSLLSNISKLRRMQIIDTTSRLESTNTTVRLNDSGIRECYNWSMRWAIGLHHHPKFIFGHFLQYFKQTRSSATRSDFERRILSKG
jgi:peptidoglycan/xylan/chitin deacetylase (PgdA/CDA1 family)